MLQCEGDDLRDACQQHGLPPAPLEEVAPAAKQSGYVRPETSGAKEVVHLSGLLARVHFGEGSVGQQDVLREAAREAVRGRPAANAPAHTCASAARRLAAARSSAARSTAGRSSAGRSTAGRLPPRSTREVQPSQRVHEQNDLAEGGVELDPLDADAGLAAEPQPIDRGDGQARLNSMRKTSTSTSHCWRRDSSRSQSATSCSARSASSSASWSCSAARLIWAWRAPSASSCACCSAFSLSSSS